MPATAGSAWPVGLLLDEIWLRSRRALVNRLEAAALWPSAEDQDRFVAEQRAKGERLRDEALLPEIAPDDRRWMTAPATFGAANRRFRGSTPMALAFGHALAAGLRELEGRPPHPPAAEAAALFNFGISVFDLLHDTQPEAVAEFSAHFGSDTLRGLHSGAASPEVLREAAPCCARPEVRLLLQTIAAVYERLHALGDEAPRDRFRALALLLEAAHAAEIGSAERTGEPSDRLAISRGKSTLPFSIIGAIAALPPPHDVDGNDPLLGDVGLVFWLTDDLTDLVGDARSGAVNSLVARSGCDGSEDIGERLQRLIDGRAIEDTADEIRDALLRIRRNTAPSGLAGTRFEQLLARSVRAWVE